ncbi:hypothetical protein HYH03_016016 [Edaphochlamys debaryana]|uniref:Uncharacterized protein n=1 Tax=Edaphochlamys debaryana TaxID=47281 RepID=A0A836BQK3_9CHLO|nr:hypothetical protein HYH03_016016 [Edaphochlamys debaryana]|eukprot:KAG2485230.1 hypothetical protein HYH03_016016 [Edaphochlamys debaryana]
MSARPEASEDSVEQEYGGDNSEGTLELLRDLGRKNKRFGSVDPSEEEGLLPPSKEECDRAQESLEEFRAKLEALKSRELTDVERSALARKVELVKNATPEDVAWMKLRAFHRGTRALAAARGDGDAASSTSASVNAASSAQRNDMPEYGAVLAAVRSSLDHSGEESEGAWWDATRLAAAATSTSGRWPAAAVRRAAVATPAAVSSTAATAHPDAAALAEAAEALIYRPDYLEERRLDERLTAQRQQRSRAFALGLAVALGASVVRWWVQRRKKGDNGGRSVPGSAANLQRGSGSASVSTIAAQ